MSDFLSIIAAIFCCCVVYHTVMTIYGIVRMIFLTISLFLTQFFAFIIVFYQFFVSSFFNEKLLWEKINVHKKRSGMMNWIYFNYLIQQANLRYQIIKIRGLLLDTFDLETEDEKACRLVLGEKYPLYNHCDGFSFLWFKSKKSKEQSKLSQWEEWNVHFDGKYSHFQ